MDDIMKMDLYDLLEITWEANEKEIRKAYRKKALSCHPDKNPDPKAAERFQQLSKALEVLTDSAAKAAYDKVLKAKKAAQKRHQELDSQRKRFKDDLDHQERLAEVERENRDREERLKKEIERLREEGSRQLKEEQERMKKQFLDKINNILEEKAAMATAFRLKVNWKAKKHDPENGGYSQEILGSVFQKYGEVTCLVVSSKKKGSALVEFSTLDAADTAFKNELGNLNNPLTLKWVSGAPPPPTAAAGNTQTNFSSTVSEDDYESLVLTSMRQAAERRRLEEQILKEDLEDPSLV